MSIQNSILKYFMRKQKQRNHQKLKGRVPPVSKARKWLDRSLGSIKKPRKIQIQPTTIGTNKAEWLIPPSPGPKTILYFHGGGYFMGSLASHRSLAAKLALETNTKILSLDYRLAPENPYPAALEDALQAYHHLLQKENLNSDQIIIAGDSAGGGLTLCTTIALRNQNQPLPAAMILLSPWTDLSGSQETYESKNDIDPLLSKDYITKVAQYYAKDIPLYDPRISPLFEDLHNLPPALIQVGTDEILLDDSRKIAEKMKTAGVPVQLEVWKGVYHVWHISWRFLPEAKKAIKNIKLFVDRI